MPFSLVGGVVSVIAQHVAERRNFGRQFAKRWRIGVGDDAGRRAVLAGIDDRAGRGAGAGGHMVVGEGRTPRSKPIMTG